MLHAPKTQRRFSEHRLGAVVVALLVAYGMPCRAEISAQESPAALPFYVNLLFDKVPSIPPADINSGAGQQYMQFLAMAGREDLHASTEGWRDVVGQCDLGSGPNDDVLGLIAERAKDTRILIINEAHDRPAHRAFIQRVASKVRELGYTVFSAETFGDNIVESEGLPYARWFDGTYSNEPAFGSLVREVKALGFRLAHHEHMPTDTDGTLNRYDRAAHREEGQANNLVQILSEMSEDERLLVHVGYSHAAEVPIKSFLNKQLAWMGSRLKAKTGIDPLTIDQTGCRSTTGSVALSPPDTRYVPGQFDVVVAHPQPAFDEGRPSWRVEPGVQKVRIPAELLSDHSRVLVEARNAGEPGESVPIDRLLLWPGEALPLLLQAGRYELIAFFENGGDPITASIEVNR